MIRLAGFFAGALLAVVSILLVLGIPELPPPEPEHVIIPYEPPEPVAKTPEQETPPAEIEPAQLAESPPVEQASPEAPVVEAPITETLLPIDESPALIEAADATQWYSFWSPFRSQIAANGFVRRLESVTGFDYRVVRVDSGKYEVAFAYSDDGEREQILSTIATATGLELPDT